MKRWWWLGVVLLLTWGAGPALAKKAKPTDPVVRGKLGKQVEEAIARAVPDLWGSVLVAHEGEIVFAKGYGAADYAAEANTPATLHELASASKQVTAAAILHLQQKRKLKVTDTLDRFFDDLPKDKHAVTLHHLLTHTSGLDKELGVAYASPIGRRAYVKQMLAPPLAATPGEVFQYSNVGYALLAAVVEEVTKKDFERYVEKALFGPAGCKETGFIGDRDLIKLKRASKRKTDNPALAGTAVEWHWGWGYRGMGGVVTTVLDLWRWDRALAGDDVLDEETRAAMVTPFKGGYAYGWQVDLTDRGTRKVHHSGGVAGYGINVTRYVDEDAAIFVLSNDGRAAFEVTRVVEALLFEPVRLEVAIDTKPYERASPRIVSLPPTLTWKARATRKAFSLTLLDGKHVVVEVTAPPAFVRKLHGALEQAIAAREAGDDGGPAAIEAGLYLQRYPDQPKLALTEGLTVDIRPEYRSGQTVDERALFVIQDAKYGMWPVMAKMNVAAARDLLTVLAKALP